MQVRNISREGVAAFLREDLSKVVPIEATEQNIEKACQVLERSGTIRVIA